MKTIIYYFTGTGNSLAVAKKIATVIGDCEPVPIASLMNTGDTIVPQADRVGIVCPVYFAGLPSMVASFAVRLDLSSAGYVFSVVTFGGSGESAALQQLDAILKGRSGRGLDAGYSVKMPGNYVLMYAPPDGGKRDAILTAADSSIDRIAKEILSARKRDLPHSFIQTILHSLMYPRFIAGVHDRDRQFTVSDACTSCGICAAVCPAGNIDLVDKKPAWKHRCELCCGCIHLCPVQAIQAGRGTEKRQRYRHPDAGIPELKRQRGEISRNERGK